jgi:hypothetical protein
VVVVELVTLVVLVVDVLVDVENVVVVVVPGPISEQLASAQLKAEGSPSP